MPSKISKRLFFQFSPQCNQISRHILLQRVKNTFNRAIITFLVPNIKEKYATLKFYSQNLMCVLGIGRANIGYSSSWHLAKLQKGIIASEWKFNGKHRKLLIGGE